MQAQQQQAANGGDLQAQQQAAIAAAMQQQAAGGAYPANGGAAAGQVKQEPGGAGPGMSLSDAYFQGQHNHCRVPCLVCLLASKLCVCALSSPHFKW
jgi:hypothetical protein